MRIATWLAPFLISLYPCEFQSRFGSELKLTTSEALEQSPSALNTFYLVWDLAIGCLRENLATTGWSHLLLAAGFFAGLLWLDRRAGEVQGSVFFLMSACFLFGAAFPDRALAWAIIFGLAIPVGNLGAYTLGLEHLNLTTWIAMVPALAAACCGVGARRMAEGSNSGALLGFCALAGLVIGLADFTLITPVPALIGAALCGWVIGRNARNPWSASAALGFAIPAAVVLMMATGGRPTRRHLVFVDARSVAICVAAAAAGRLVRGATSGSGPLSAA